MGTVLLRAFLLGGLLVHKATWWVLERRQGAVMASAEEMGVRVRLIRVLKRLVLLALVCQPLIPSDMLGPLAISDDPWLYELTGTCLYGIGLAVALAGRIYLGDNWSDIERPRVGREQEVVSRGIYRFIRHPIYAGDTLLLLGFELALNCWLVLGIAVLIPIIVWRALAEERMLSERLPAYRDYCARTKRFVPFVV